MKTLKINQKGLFINIVGIPNFRTPAIVDVTKIDTELIRAELRRHGIISIKIYKKDENEIITDKKEKIKNIKDINIEGNKILNINELDKIIEEQKLNKDTINRIEKLLTKLLETSQRSEISYLEDQIFKKKKIEDEEIDDFIPAINLSNIKINMK